jgi:hypothetical protein
MSLVFIALNYLSEFSTPSNHYMNTINEYNSLINEDKEIDVAIYGSSHAYCSYNPRVIDSITKTRSFNFGNDSQRLAVSNFVMKETLKKISPKLVVLDVYIPSIKNPEGAKALGFQKSSYYYFQNFSPNKISSVFKVFPVKETPEVLFPVFRKKDLVSNFNSSRKNYYTKAAKAKEYRGFVGFDLEMKPMKPLSQEKLLSLINKNKTLYDGFTQEEEESIISFIEKVKNKGSNLLIVVAPYYAAFAGEKHAHFHNYMKTISDKYKIDFLDINLVWNEIGLDYKDFKDKSHLGTKGAKKVSKYLANYINTNYELPSRENELAWVEEQPKTLKSFITETFPKTSLEVDKKLNDKVYIESIDFFKEGTISKSLIIKLKNKTSDSVLSKYRLGFHTYVNDKDLINLTSYSKSKKRNADAWDFIPKITEINGTQYIIKNINTPINSFPKIKLFLYDSKGYKGVIGKNVEVEDIRIK